MAKFCPYCGKRIKESDKFCIYCGKPIVTDVPKAIDTKKEEKKKEVKKIEVEEVEEEEEEEELEEEEEEEEKEGKKGKKDKKKSKKEKDKEEKREPKPLPDDVKEQINLHIELNDIDLKKKALADKLRDLSRMAKAPDYDVDVDYQEKISLQLEAVKKVSEELKQQENELKQKIQGEFIVKKLNDDINTREFQLKNLTREFRLHKIDKATFDKLRDKYKRERKTLKEEREDLRNGIELWIEEIKMERSETSSLKKLNKGRYSAKEIEEEEFTKKDEEFKKKLEKIDSKIKTLEELIK